MSRSKWKSPFLDNFILDGNFEKISKIWSRRSVIPSYLIGKMVLIHNGKIFKKLFSVVNQYFALEKQINYNYNFSINGDVLINKIGGL